jgi:hypothetical protein
MFDRFTSRSVRVLELSFREALRDGSAYIRPEHIRRALDREETENAGKDDFLPHLEMSGVTIKSGLVEIPD